MATSPTVGYAVIKRADITIGKFLGRGGFGSVRLATHRNWGDVAVKEFNNVTLTDEVRREAKKMLRAIHSSYIVRVIGLMDDPNNLCIVMEYLENGSLKQFQRKYMNCSCWARKVKMMLDISLGMNYLHTLDPPIIHLDLKLDNVFVGNGFEAKVGDLGLAISATSTQNFSTGDTPGTCSHIPPEAWEGTVKIPDKFWDIFTFAITMFEFLSGMDPWQAFAKPALIGFWIMQNKRPDVSAIPPEAPIEIIQIMKKCWNGKPSQRPQFQEIQETIANVFQSRYKQGLQAADIKIMQTKMEVDVSAEQEGTSSWDSGFSTLEKGVKEMRVGSSAESHTTLTQGQAALTEAHSVQQWRIVKQFGKEGDGQGEFKRATRIAVCNNQDIVVVDFDLERVYLFSKDYEYKLILVSPKGNPKTKLLFPVDVAVTSQGHIAVVEASSNPERSKYVKVFNVNGAYLHSFSTVADDESYTEIASHSVVVAADGKFLVGDMDRKCVTIHTGSDGGLIQKVNLNMRPLFLATNRHHHIYASDWQACKVVTVDYSGTMLFILDSFKIDGKKGIPQGLTCGDDDTLYIAVKKLDESTGGAFINTGHIHQYSPEGRFIGCLITGLYDPRGITWHNDSLYVANGKSVVILGKSSSP